MKLLFVISTDQLINLCIALALVLTLLILVAMAFTKHNVNSLVYAAVCVALSWVLNFIKLFSLPYGGSVTLARMAPLLLYAFAFGWRKGLLAGFAYSLLDFMIGGYILNPIQYLMDYLVPFSLVGLAGLVRNNKTAPFAIGTLIAAFGRFIPQFISGFVFWGMYLPEDFPIQNAVVYSLWYNATVFLDMLLAYIAVRLFMSVPQARKHVMILKNYGSEQQSHSQSA